MAVLSQPRGTDMLALSRRLIACHLWRRRRGLVEDGLCEAHERSLPLGDVPPPAAWDHPWGAAAPAASASPPATPAPAWPREPPASFAIRLQDRYSLQLL